MVSAECFRGAGEPPVRGFEYGPIEALRQKDKLAMLEHLDVMVCKHDMPTPGEEERLFAPESTLRPPAPKPAAGDLAGFLTQEEDGGSQRSKGSKGATTQPTQESLLRCSQPTQVSPKPQKPTSKSQDEDDLFEDDRPPKPFAGSNIKSFFQPTTAQVKAKGLGKGGEKRQRVVEEVSDSSTSDSSATDPSDDSSDGDSDSSGAKKKKKEKKKKTKKAKKAKKAKKTKKAKKIPTPRKTKKARAEEVKEELKQGVATILLQLCYYFL